VVVLGPKNLDTGLRRGAAGEKERSAKGQRPARRVPDAKATTVGEEQGGAAAGCRGMCRGGVGRATLRERERDRGGSRASGMRA